MHHHGADHSKHESVALRVKLALFVTFGFVGFEIFAGFYAGSIGLLSDAGHNFTDGLSLLLTYSAIWLGTKPSSDKHTYGMHRAGILAALFNGLTLIVIGIFIIASSVFRLYKPIGVDSGVMLFTAVAAFLANIIAGYFLHKDSGHDLNIRAAYIHMVGDAAISLGVAFAAILIRLTGRNFFDPAISLIIGLFIIFSAYGILKESVNILLEGTPKGFDLAKIKQRLGEIDGVKEVHDMHLWSLSSGMLLFTCHILIDIKNEARALSVLQEAKELLLNEFNISHSTIQVEMEDCGNDHEHCHIEKLHIHRH